MSGGRQFLSGRQASATGGSRLDGQPASFMTGLSGKESQSAAASSVCTQCVKCGVRILAIAGQVG